jgi:hypothetical protein
MNNQKLSLMAFIVYALVQTIMTVTMTFLLLDAKAARVTSTNQRKEILCILKVEPHDRSDAVFERCRP